MNFKQQQKQRILEIWGNEPKTLDELGFCVLAVLNQQTPIRYPRHKKPLPKIHVVGLKWDVSFGTVSNSHYCPIDGVTCWNSQEAKDGRPTGYLGWMGRVWVRYRQEFDSIGSDPFSATLTYTGTGGFGGYSGPWDAVYHHWYNKGGRRGLPNYPEPRIYSWDYRFFGQDWPDIFTEFEKKIMWAELAKQKFHPPKHVFHWEDPLIQQQDQEFLSIDINKLCIGDRYD